MISYNRMYYEYIDRAFEVSWMAPFQRYEKPSGSLMMFVCCKNHNV